MSKPWKTLEEHPSPDGLFELRQRDLDDFLICIDGRVLMNSRASRSEEELGIQTCQDLPENARVLVGGLGMGLTLRAVLDTIPQSARVNVAELYAVVGEWCRGPLAELSGGAVLDPRVSLQIENVADSIRKAADAKAKYNAIVLDLFEGPHARTQATKDPLYGSRAIEKTWHALAKGGVLGVWAEARDEKYEARLRKKGFVVETRRPGRGGFRHWIVLAKRP
ncbi:MAG: spermidine synthase [Myxococcota bacterium]